MAKWSMASRVFNPWTFNPWALQGTSEDSEDVVGGLFCVKASEIYAPGSSEEEIYIPGASAEQVGC